MAVQDGHQHGHARHCSPARTRGHSTREHRCPPPSGGGACGAGGGGPKPKVAPPAATPRRAHPRDAVLRPRRNPPPKHEQSAPSQPQPRTHLPLKGPEDGGHRRSHLKSSRWETPSGGGALKPEVLPLQGEVPAEQAEGAPKPKVALSAATPRRPHPRDAPWRPQPRPSRSERERQRTKRRIWHQPSDSSSLEPIDTQTRQPTRDRAPAVEPYTSATTPRSKGYKHQWWCAQRASPVEK